MIFLSLLGRPGSPPLPRNMQDQGMGANLACFWEHRQTQPWFQASTPSQMDRKTDDRYRYEDAGSDQEFGEPRDTACALRIPSTCCMGILPSEVLPGRFRSLGSLFLLSPASAMPRRPLTDVLAKRRETLAEEEQPDSSLSAGRASCLGHFPAPLPGHSPGGPMSSDH